MNKTIILIILLTLPSAVCFAQADLEASFSGNYTYHSLFDPGYGFTVSGAMITERQHKLNIGLTYLRATLSEDEFWEIGAAAPDGYDYDYPTSSGDMSAFSFEVAPMFKFNQADDVRNYIGLGLNLVPIKVKEKGSYTLYTYDNNI
ncbi:MAG: hypothetical protein RAP03_04540, partial [Candidatus Electryonea clarkiae]|nr:hypothetical protein [Candidatus Electryonea clarkiae]